MPFNSVPNETLGHADNYASCDEAYQHKNSSKPLQNKGSIVINETIGYLSPPKSQKGRFIKQKIKTSAEIEEEEKEKLRKATAELIDKSKSEAIDLSFLLNLFDGVLETPGRIIIMTSNYPEKLDRALIRPGRIDSVLKFEKCTSETIVRMINHFYDDKISATPDQFVGGLLTPAELTQLLFKHIENPISAINDIIETSKSKVTQQ